MKMSRTEKAPLLARFTSEVEALSCEREPRAARATLLIAAGAIVVGLLLASQARIDRIVTGNGQLATQERTVVVGSLNRAIIKSIDVREGDLVRAGQVLTTLDPTFAEADVAQLEVQLQSLDAEIARLDAEIADRPLDIDRLSPNYAALQTSLMTQRANERAEKLRGYDAKIAQQESTIAKLTANRARYDERGRLMREVEDMRRKLAEQQVGSRLMLLQAMDQRLEVLRNADFDANSLEEARHLRDSLRSDRETFQEQWRTQAQLDLIKNRTTRDATVEQLTKAQKNQDLVTLRAPSDGIVQQIGKFSVGSVLTEGVQLVTLVPLNAKMETEVSIDARDVGFVRPGDPVTLKLAAYDYLEHGHVEGTVRTISEDAFSQQSGQPIRPFYKATITIDRTALRNVPDSFRLNPGMPVTADVKVGTRSLLSYLVRGALRTTDEAMREP
jgi:HlyD family secretion protein